MKCYTLLLSVLLQTATTAAAQAPPARVTVIILDTSGSMSGTRIDSVKAEIEAVARQLPPTKDHPFILIPFAGSPHHVGTFTDLRSFEAHLRSIHAEGATNIAAALTRGLQELARYPKASHLCFTLYTDAKDTDSSPEAIAAAEQRLDALFSARHKKGLANLLFVKRWENSQAQLLANIAKKGHTRIIDAKDLKVVPVTLKPTVRILRASWAKDKPLTLEIEAQGQLELKGIDFDPSFPTAQLCCTNPGADLKPLALRPGDPKSTLFAMRVPISQAIAASGKHILTFSLGAVGDFSLKNRLVFPLVSADRITVPLTLPPLEVRCTLSAALSPLQPATWSDPFTGKAVQQFTFTCTIRAQPDCSWPAPLAIQLEPEGSRLVAGRSTLEFHGPDSVSSPVTLEAAIPTGSAQFAPSVFVRPQLPRGFTMTPPHVRVTASAPAPKPVDTKITAQVQSISEPTWTDLAQGTATFHADVAVQIVGPIPADTRLVLLCPSAIRSIQIDPAVLRTGTQTVRLTIDAQFPPAPKVAQFDLKTQAPAPIGAVRFLPPPPLKLRVASPQPLQLAMLSPQGASPAVTVRDSTGPVTLTAIPTLLGQDAKMGSGLSAIVRSGRLFGSQKTGLLPLNVPMVLPVSLPVTETSFFFDTIIEEDIDILPAQPSAALVGTRQRCTVTLEAPFKRIFFYIASAISAILLLVMVVRAFIRFSNTESNSELANAGAESDDDLA